MKEKKKKKEPQGCCLKDFPVMINNKIRLYRVTTSSEEGKKKEPYIYRNCCCCVGSLTNYCACPNECQKL